MFRANTEIVITRTAGTVTTVVAELDNIEEISVNTLNVTANDGGGLNTGANSGDTIQVFGKLQHDQPQLQHHHHRWQCRK